MSDEHTEEQEPAVVAGGVGARLREAREEAGLELNEVAAKTRIPQRHLLTIENGALTDLPARTYAVGFSRTYARLVGLDEREIVEQARMELAAEEDEGRTPAKFEPGDPARVPGKGLAWFALFAAILLIGGIYAFYSSYLAPGMGPAPLDDPAARMAEAETDDADESGEDRTPTAASGPVVFTSEMDGTWVKFYDADGERLYEAQMDEGDSFTVPADAEGPQVWTGRPYALAITVGGRSVPKLSEVDEVIKDVPITAEALLARADAAPRAPATPAPGEG
ncbi:helix-turn-helix domain-containing protein [Qipengyuania flava]|uniref:helix-turn-helix domain-containing protein n=1 Tax=Qipengyuania flava TaxID=192812 RepID=UPI000B8BC065|nr:RodZ domain-containing protein [Qipengyuania flava]ASP31083.1 helix-turn-helix domain-containing protein [Qipengyuania flava]